MYNPFILIENNFVIIDLQTLNVLLYLEEKIENKGFIIFEIMKKNWLYDLRFAC